MEIKPCPVCGSQPTTTHINDLDEPFWVIECIQGDSYQHGFHCVQAFSRRNGTLEEAITTWNTRYKECGSNGD